MGIAQPKKKISIEEYLEIEGKFGYKCEFNDGEVKYLEGGTIEHGIISGNIFCELVARLRNRNSADRGYASAVRIYIEAINTFLYSDGFATVGKPKKKENLGICNPILIIEVLSKSTAEYDRSEKFDKYRKLSSLREYVLIDQEKFMVEIFFKPAKADLWKITRYEGADKIIHFESVDLKISMTEIYEDVLNA